MDKPTELVCANCGLRFSAVAKRNFFGFKGAKCPECGRGAQVPLSTALLVVYLVVLVAVSVSCVWLYLELSLFTLPGALAVLVIIALILNGTLKGKIARAEVARKARLGSSPEGE